MADIQPHRQAGGIGNSAGGFDFGATELAAQTLSGGQTQDLSTAISNKWNNYWSPQASSGSILGDQNSSRMDRSIVDPNAKKDTTTQRDTTTRTNTGGGNQGGGVDWSNGLTGEQVRAMGLNPDAMTSSGGKFYNSNSGSGGGERQVDWDSIYNPQYRALNDRTSTLNDYISRESGQANTDYAAYGKSYLDENAQLNRGLDEQRRQLYESGRSAAGQARNSFNALSQQNASRYGLGSGAGQFVSDLLGQEYLRSQGAQQQTEQSGMYQLGVEGEKVMGILTSKKGELEKWKRETDDSINDYFKQSMEAINKDRSLLDERKAAKKEEAVINAINYKKQATDADNTYRQGLATSAMQMFANQSDVKYTPAEIQQIVTQFMNVGAYNPAAQQQQGQVSNIGYNQGFTYKNGVLVDENGNPV